VARILLFNPSHEMALAVNTPQYTPPRQVRLMESELSRLPFLWAHPGDCVLTGEGLVNVNGTPLMLSPDMKPEPWGWNLSVRRRFLRLGVSADLMPTETQIGQWRQYASREWAVTYNRHFYQALPDAAAFVSNQTSFCHNVNQLTEWMSQQPEPSFIFKSAFSSSGRGNRIIRNQESLSALHLFDRTELSLFVDRYYERLLDFAMEFRIDENEIRYLGLSVFHTSADGRYAYNLLGAQSDLQARITPLLSPSACQVFPMLAQLHKVMLTRLLLHRYTGIVGVDMMVVKGGMIHPCVEINLRMNMGVVAMHLYQQQYTSSQVERYGGEKFRPIIDNGRFYLSVR